MDRRTFVGALFSVPVALAMQPLIGETGFAGGLYVPAPRNLEEYVRFYPPVQPWNQDATVLKATACIAWASPGARTAELQMFGGTAVLCEPMSPALEAAKRQNLLESFRTLWDDSHYPGWLAVHRSEPDGGVDNEGYPTMRTWQQWTRVSYLRWMTPSELTSPRIEVTHG